MWGCVGAHAVLQRGHRWRDGIEGRGHIQTDPLRGWSEWMGKTQARAHKGADVPCEGSFTRLKTHTLRFQAQWVDGMLKTRVKPCDQPYGMAHPAQKLDVTKPRLTVGVATALPDGVFKHRVFRPCENVTCPSRLRNAL